ncbi:MAG TPA: Uma2 family endonuclease [Blastocatellia bacterium]|nr:Uma2 family endonuclease [Blastocatellia bacterium]
MATDRKDVPQHFYSLDEYFALEHAGHVRYEYWNGEIVCMSGGSLAHGTLCSNVHFRLRQRLDGGRCRAFTSEMPVKTHTLLPYRYPDITVVCGEMIVEKMRGIDALVNPVLIVEVLSPTSEDRDRQDKFTAYQAIPGFREYLLVAQDKLHVTHYARQLDGKWNREDVTEMDAGLTLSSIACTLPMSEIYEDVTFSSV